MLSQLLQKEPIVLSQLLLHLARMLSPTPACKASTTHCGTWKLLCTHLSLGAIWEEQKLCFLPTKQCIHTYGWSDLMVNNLTVLFTTRISREHHITCFFLPILQSQLNEPSSQSRQRCLHQSIQLSTTLIKGSFINCTWNSGACWNKDPVNQAWGPDSLLTQLCFSSLRSKWARQPIAAPCSPHTERSPTSVWFSSSSVKKTTPSSGKIKSTDLDVLLTLSKSWCRSKASVTSKRSSEGFVKHFQYVSVFFP